MFEYIHEIVGIIFGIGLFFAGSIKLSKKRLIENIPTSKIRSVAMGLAELKGKAKQKFSLKSPITFTDCVYYKFLIEEKEARFKEISDKGIKVRPRSRWKIISEGSSTNYFYIEDETGKILVDPLDAEVILSVDYRSVDSVGTEIVSPKRRYTEWYIKPDETIYVLGTVKKFKDGIQNRREKLIYKLRQLKEDKEKLKQFDLDKDGHISIEEWDKAREKIEQELLEEELQEQRQEIEDDIVIAKGDTEKTFVISDRSEKDLIKKILVKGYLFIFFGFCIIIIMVTLLLARLGLLKENFVILW